jgi:phospholipase C
VRITRRELVAGSVGAGSCVAADSGDSAVVQEAGIDHVIVVMMENRSFDHFLGALSLLEGRADVDGLQVGMSNPDAAGNGVGLAHTEMLCVPDPGHGWDSSHGQFNGGANDGFVLDYGGEEVMRYQDRGNLPITYALADQYAICDAYFCSVMGPTWPNRFYGHSGTSLGMRSNDFGIYDLPTAWNHLEERGIAWKYYFVDLPFIVLLKDNFRTDRSGYLEDFVADAEAGRLPAVCWVDPGFGLNDDHPPHFVGAGQMFLAAVAKALGASPQWNRCLWLLTYDEHGGFFDHVPPPKTEDDYAADGFDQLGFRVPVVAIGPWVKQGAVKTTFDHTSWLKFLCELHDIEPWTKRIAAANSLAEVLDLDRMARNEPLPPPELPAYDYPLETLPDECGGQAVMGPPAPSGDARGPGPVVYGESWQPLVKMLAGRDDRSAELLRRAAWTRRYVNGK